MSRERFDRWLALAEAQLEAARKVDPAALSVATDARRALQDELARVPVAALDPDSRAHAARVARRIREIDLRVQACGNAVMGVLERVLPDAAPRTYGRRGQMRGF